MDHAEKITARQSVDYAVIFAEKNLEIKNKLEKLIDSPYFARFDFKKMEFMIDSSLNIVDDVLQRELSRSSDSGMKNIVSTIQRNQNMIIRDEDSEVLIIQGVAGSGKTSIALHRIAFLLYRFKETLKSEDILIISPNKVFGSYISNVLPELGEESVGEIQMESLAMDLLNQKYEFQTFFEQTNYLLEKNDKELKNRIKYKSNIKIIKEIDEYVKYLNKKIFISRDLWVGGCFAPHWLFDEVFQSNISYSKKECVNEMTDIIKQKIFIEYKYDLETKEKNELKKAIEKMHQGKDLLKTYQGFFDFIGEKNLFKFCKNNILEYCNIFPLIYLKIVALQRNVYTR
jgi:DNA helicase II / ATP-dependent DNA helicase PcrA